MQDPFDDTNELVRRAAMAAITVALTLIAVKTVAWLMTSSVALLSSLADSLMDSMASGLNLVAIRASLSPPDREHRFGHGKAEPLAGLGQAAFVIGASLFLAINGVEHLISQEPVTHSGVGIGVMVVSTLLTGGLVLYQRHVLKRAHSVVIHADSLHYTGDVIMNLTVVASLLLADHGLIWVDGVAGIGVAAYMTAGALEIGRRSLGLLMDAELPDTERQQIIAMAIADPDVAGVHDLRTRSSGRTVFIQLHLELPGTMTLSAAHAVGDRVAEMLLAQFPDADVLVHTDPLGEGMPHDWYGD